MTGVNVFVMNSLISEYTQWISWVKVASNFLLRLSVMHVGQMNTQDAGLVAEFVALADRATVHLLFRCITRNGWWRTPCNFHSSIQYTKSKHLLKCLTFRLFPESKCCYEHYTVYTSYSLPESQNLSKLQYFNSCESHIILEALLGGGGEGRLVKPLYPLISGGSYPLSQKLSRLLSPSVPKITYLLNFTIVANFKVQSDPFLHR